MPRRGRKRRHRGRRIALAPASSSTHHSPRHHRSQIDARCVCVGLYDSPMVCRRVGSGPKWTWRWRCRCQGDESGIERRFRGRNRVWGARGRRQQRSERMPLHPRARARARRDHPRGVFVIGDIGRAACRVPAEYGAHRGAQRVTAWRDPRLRPWFRLQLPFTLLPLPFLRFSIVVITCALPHPLYHFRCFRRRRHQIHGRHAHRGRHSHRPH
ncbi:hypothetical protein C8R45DRAFT_985194 [Mycena sanguinolenta]|nr:hypothetical protein C8R45DRAFT_985194 [Mycena sanguinolenta]